MIKVHPLSNGIRKVRLLYKMLISVISTVLFVFQLAITISATPTSDITASYKIPTIEQLTNILRYELVPYSEDYIVAAMKYGINVYFLVAKDALESGWGRYQAAENNLGGWRNNKGEYMKFVSIPEYIDYSARNIKGMYLTKDGQYYEGYTLEDVGKHYNGSTDWVIAVEEIWITLEQKIADYS